MAIVPGAALQAGGVFIPSGGGTSKCVKNNGSFCWDFVRENWTGTFEPALRNAGVGIVGFMKLLQGFERSNIDEAFFRAYSEPFAQPSECHGVIAFPKSGRGEDLLVKSPNQMTRDQLATYHLKVEE